MDVVSHNDLTGAPIKPGALIVYPAQELDSSVLKFAIVTRLASRKERRWDLECGSVEYDHPTVRVIAASTHVYTHEKGFSSDWELHRDGKEIALSHVNRILVVEKYQVPVRPRELLVAAYNRFVEKVLDKAIKTARPA